MSNLKTTTKISNLEKSDVKLRAYQFSLSLIDFLTDLPNTKIYLTLTNQLLRSGTSIGANIVEAKASSSKREFIKYYEIALKSANETKYWLCLIRDGKFPDINKNKLSVLLQEAIELSSMLGSSLLTLKGKRI